MKTKIMMKTKIKISILKQEIMIRVTFLLLPLFILLSNQAIAQNTNITISGIVKDKNEVLSFVNVILKTEKDSAFVTGAITNEEGFFSLSNIKPGNYLLTISFIGYKTKTQPLFVGNLSPFLDLATIKLEDNPETLAEFEVIEKQEEVDSKMDKKTFDLEDNISQSGGSVLQTMQNLPGVAVQNGKVQLRGNENVTVLIDGKQTALTGFGSQNGLDNIPASAIEKIEIINNPSSKYDANGNAGIINIIYKKNKQNGLNGKVSLTSGVGALWVKKENLPTIREQYQYTPKLNPSLSLNYRKNKVNFFFQGDYSYKQTLNKNEFTTRTYDDGTIINQQVKRNRNTNIITSKLGVDWNMNKNNTLTLSGFFSSEKIIDNGDEPFFNQDLTERYRLWQFLEDELKTTIVASANFEHKFKQPGRSLTAGFNYTFHREDEKYFFDNILPTYTGKNAFKLLSDEHVADFNLDYIRPLKYGKIETGIKLRQREIPTNMQFIPGLNSPLDSNAGGWATYKETIPAVYGTYTFENKSFEAEIGLRVEYVKLQYDVNPNHNTYKSDGYNYTQPFPNVRFAYKINDYNKLSIFYTRRVDRPNEVDIRIFPKYDDAEIIKVGNPALRPQFTNSIELGDKISWKKGYFYSAIFHKITDGSITRIASTIPNSTLIYSIFQNANRNYNSGVELLVSQELKNWWSFNLNLTAYHNQIDAFTVYNKYPEPNTFNANKQESYSGNVKLNNIFHLPKKLDVQVTAIYLAPDIIPQSEVSSRFSLDMGMKKIIQKGKGEIYLNASDLLNTMIIKKKIKGNGFEYTSANYYETQVIRLGYSYKF